MSTAFNEIWEKFKETHQELKTLEILSNEEVANTLGWQADQMPADFSCIHFRMEDDLNLIKRISHDKSLFIVESSSRASIGLLKSIAQNFSQKLEKLNSFTSKAS